MLMAWWYVFVIYNDNPRAMRPSPPGSLPQLPISLVSRTSNGHPVPLYLNTEQSIVAP